MNPTISLVTEVEVTVADGAAVVETTKETSLMDHWWWWRQEVSKTRHHVNGHGV